LEEVTGLGEDLGVEVEVMAEERWLRSTLWEMGWGGKKSKEEAQHCQSKIGINQLTGYIHTTQNGGTTSLGPQINVAGKGQKGVSVDWVLDLQFTIQLERWWGWPELHVLRSKLFKNINCDNYASQLATAMVTMTTKSAAEISTASTTTTTIVNATATEGGEDRRGEFGSDISAALNVIISFMAELGQIHLLYPKIGHT
jgi:hypothetical protein